MQGDYYYVYVDTVHSLRDGYRQQAIDMDFEHDAGEGGRWGGLGGQRWRMTDEAQADVAGMETKDRICVERKEDGSGSSMAQIHDKTKQRTQ